MNKFHLISVATIVAFVTVATAADENKSNNTKPIIFLTSPPEDSKNAGSEPSKTSVNSRGYQLEVLEDNSDEAQSRAETGFQSQKGSEHQLNIFPTAIVQQTPSLIDQYLQQPGLDYDDNSAKEKEFTVPKATLAYGDIKPRADISKVRDIFVGKEVNEKQQESKYKLDYESSPLKYGGSPIVLKQSSLPVVESAAIPVPIPLPHPHLHHEEIVGHTAGYGHGFHHHEQKLKAKPLKPSVVYRDPSDSFDHHDKIRTLDKDHLGGSHEKVPIHPYGPHVIKHHGHNHEHGHEYGAYRHGKVVFKPEYYDPHKTPECAYKNKYIYNLTFCLDDPHYPTETIIYALKDAGYHAKKLLSDVTYQSADNLVTGLTRAEEEGYTYKHYFGASHAQNVHLDKYKPPYQGYTYSTDYFKKGGYICPSDIYYARPKRAMNTFGKWKVIVNVDHDHYGHHEHGHHGHHNHHHGGHYEKDHHLHGGHGHGLYEKDHHHEPHGHQYGHGHGHGVRDDYGPEHHNVKKREYKEVKKTYTQTLRLEQCIYQNAPCSYVDAHFHSRCIQKHNFVRLVAWTHEEGIHVDTFKLPIACSCHVRQPIHFYHESGHHEHKHGHVVPPVNNYHHDHHHQEPHGHHDHHEPHGHGHGHNNHGHEPHGHGHVGLKKLY